MIGSRGGVFKPHTFAEAGTDCSCSPQICFLSSRSHVRIRAPLSLFPYCLMALTIGRPEIFDEYTRRQYVAKAPHRNPFGEDEEPAKFNDFDIFTRIRVLQQLSTWTLGNTERIRGMMPQDEDHLNWRMEPLGWDKDDRAYFVLDDNRLYRRTDEPPPPPTPKLKPKAKSKAPKKSKSRGTRASKRQRVEESEEEVDGPDAEAVGQDDTVMTNGDQSMAEDEPGYGFTSKTWECIAITLEEYQEFLASIFRTRDPNEKQLRKRIEEEVLPIIEKRAEALRQKQLKKMRELQNLQKMATAKRSSRIADKAEKEKQDREEREVEEKKQADLRMAHEEQERQRRIEEGHESRRLTREQRLKEREVKRILHEEELAKIEDQATRASSQDPASDVAADGSKRMSERQLKTQKEQHKKELQMLADEEDKWIFDCDKCGMHGENLDDGTHSIACERCSVWQHSKCHGFSPKQAEKEGFHFVCKTCKRKEAEAKKPKIPPLKLGKNRQSASPETQRVASRPPTANGQSPGGLPDHVARQLDNVQFYHPQGQIAGPFGQITNGPSLSPYGQAQGPPGYRYPPVGNFAPRSHPPPPQQPWQGSPLPPPGRPPSSGYAGSPPPPMANGYGSPNHQQQHQQMHQRAVASAGGHPPYQSPQQPPQSYGYSPHASGGMQPMAPLPPQHQQYFTGQPPYSQQQTPYQQPPEQRSGSGHLANGFQSPIKSAAKPSNSPPQNQHQPSYGQTHGIQQPYQRLAPSPSAKFPPHPPTYPQHGAQSPVKSSSTQVHPQQAAPQRPSQPPPQLAQTPQTYRPASTNGVPPNYQTPQQAQPSPAGANANAVAADGMSGPWPESSKAIPQKHDQSPQPPFSSQTVGETKVMPPAAPLVPSPSQQMQAAAAGPQSVPVKKMPDVNGGPPPPIPPLTQGLPDGGHLGKAPEMNSVSAAPVQQQTQLGSAPPKSVTAKADIASVQPAPAAEQHQERPEVPPQQ